MAYALTANCQSWKTFQGQVDLTGMSAKSDEVLRLLEKNINYFLFFLVFSIVFSLKFFFNPFQAAVFILALTGIPAIAVGTILIIVAMKMKNFFRHSEG